MYKTDSVVNTHTQNYRPCCWISKHIICICWTKRETGAGVCGSWGGTVTGGGHRSVWPRAKPAYACLQPCVHPRNSCYNTGFVRIKSSFTNGRDTDMTSCDTSSWRCSSLSLTLLMGSAIGGCWWNIQKYHVLTCASNREYLPCTNINSSQRNRTAIKSWNM